MKGYAFFTSTHEGVFFFKISGVGSFSRTN